jgi:hypothetical protein
MMAQQVGEGRLRWVGCANPSAPSILSSSPPRHQHDQDPLGRQLRAMYEDLLQEPIPGRFLALIARLERQDREQGDGR